MKRLTVFLIVVVAGCFLIMGCGNSTSTYSSEETSANDTETSTTVTDATIRQDYTSYMQTIWHLRGQIIDGVSGATEELQTYVNDNQSKIEGYQPTESDLISAKIYIDQLGNQALLLVRSQDTNTQRSFNDTVQAICKTLKVASGE